MRKLIFTLLIAVVAASCSTNTITVKPGESIPDAIAKARRSGAPAVIRLKEGTYRISSPVVLTPEDSGITIIGAGMGKTIVSGGRDLPPFTQQQDGSWIADLSEVMSVGADIQQLFVGGRRATLARTPDEGEFFVTGPVEEICSDDAGAAVKLHPAPAFIRCHVPGAASAALEKVGIGSSQLKVSILYSWNYTRRNVLSWSVADSLILFAGPPQKPWCPLDRCSQFYLEDDISFMDSPGEWYYDIGSRKLHYLPREGETVSGTAATLPFVESLLELKGEETAHVKDVRVSGITFAHTLHRMNWRGEDPQQSSSGTGAVILADFADGLRIEECEVVHTGNSAVWFRQGCRDCSISRCLLEDLGVGGVKIGENKRREDEDTYLTRGIVVDNNIIRYGSRVMPTGPGVILFDASDCRITHNEIADFGYSGMSIGWQWGYDHSPSKRNLAAYNHIHHIGWGYLSDMGGVYTLGKSEGTHVDHNVIHDIYSYGYGGWGLYTDEGSTDITMAYNLVYNCKSSAFHQHYGENNHIVNNIFAGQIRAQMEATRIEPHKSFDFVRNVICYSQGDMYGMRWGQVNADCRANLYWCYTGDVSFNGLTLGEWQEKTGWDAGSVICDPGFTDCLGTDFTVRDSSNLQRIGFEPFDWTEAGVYGDDAWVRLAATDPDMAARFAARVAECEAVAER